MQCYLLRERDAALLVGTGLTIHQQQLFEQVDALLGEASLSIMPLALDFMRMSNARPLAQRYGIDRVYQPGFQNEPSAWLNFRPDFPDDESDRLRSADVGVMTTGQPVEFADGRTLDLIVPPLRLLPNPWLYDRETRTMFTVDVFTWVWRDDNRGPWLVAEDDADETTLDTVTYCLFRNRYWWLPGADTTRLRHSLAEVFDRFDVTRIAPDFGCVLEGPDVVRRHVALLDEALAAAAAEAPIGVDVGSWAMAGTQ